MLLDAVWTWYLGTAMAIVLGFGTTAPQGQPWAFLALYAGALAGVLAIRGATKDSSLAVQRGTRAAFAIVVVPTVFSALGWVLPGVHAEPFEWLWIAWDRAVVGADPTRLLSEGMSSWAREGLQWVYAAFYLLPVAAVVGAGWRRGGEEFEAASTLVVFCFLVSYLGYFLFPTLPPYRFLPHEPLASGLWAADAIYLALDEAELHKWNCMPSGHTMLSLVALWVARRGPRWLFWLLVPVVATLIYSTIALRYHYLADVVAGALLAAPSVWLGQRLWSVWRA